MLLMWEAGYDAVASVDGVVSDGNGVHYMLLLLLMLMMMNDDMMMLMMTKTVIVSDWLAQDIQTHHISFTSCPFNHNV